MVVFMEIPGAPEGFPRISKGRHQAGWLRNSSKKENERKKRGEGAAHGKEKEMKKKKPHAKTALARKANTS